MEDRSYGFARALAAAAPLFLGLAGALALALPVRPFEGLAPMPVLPLLVVFYWAIEDPGLMRSPAVFAIGMTQDILQGGPPGVWAAAYLVALLAVRDQRDFFLGRDWTMMWLGATLSAAIVAAVVWALMSLLSTAVLPVAPIAIQMAVTALCYPFLAPAFRLVQARLELAE